MAAKKTAELIPLCHPLPLTHVSVELTPIRRGYRIEARVRTASQTGVEMEALTAVAVAALTIYDMAKAVDKEMVIGDICLVEKKGGRSGHYRRKTPGPDRMHVQPISEPHTHVHYYRLALILGALTAIGPLAIDMYLPALPTIAREFGTAAERRAVEPRGVLRRHRHRSGVLRAAVRPAWSQADPVSRAGAVHRLVGRLRAGRQSTR